MRGCGVGCCALLIFYANSPKGQAQTKLRKSSYARNHNEKYSIGLCSFYCLDLVVFYEGMWRWLLRCILFAHKNVKLLNEQ